MERRGSKGRAMHAPIWRLSGVDRRALKEARLQAHHALQWLARMARAYVPARPDDAHTNLGWGEGAFTTHALRDGAQLRLTIADLTLAIVEQGRATSSFPLGGRSDADVRRWLGEVVTARGLDARALDRPLPYELPAHAAAGRPEALAELARWFDRGASALETARVRLLARGIGAPELRCWPHHFDLDSLVSFGAGRTAGFGFEPGDDYYDEPYFYVSLYPAPDVAKLPPLPSIAHWHSHHFTAAIATASTIAASSDPQAAVEDYLRAAVDAVLAAFAR
jgi:hypothetical protein